MQPYSKIDTAALNEFLNFEDSYTVDLIYNPGDLTAIYHYTDLNGLKGIVDNHDLWLTHSRYSNDDEELTHGFQIVQRVIQEELAKETDPGREDCLKQISRMFETPKREGIYICCFCAKGNLLSQWWSYGANGTGVSLSFDPARFDYITGPDSPPSGLIRLWKVFYQEMEQCKIVRDAISFYWKKATPQIEERVNQAADAIQFFVPTFKNRDFEEEDEIRLIFTPFPDTPIKPQFRISRGMLVPYYSLKELSGSTSAARPLPLLKVCVGPSANEQLNLESAKMLLVKAGYKDVSAESANTPYRG
jgi:Protein of unknown function (DUF2971)